MNRRLASTVVLFICIIIFPYWIYIPLLVLSSIFFPFYWEGIIFGFLIDVLYGVQAHTEISLVYPFAMFISLLVLVMLPIRERIRINA